ncbi:succinate dehydrogenase, hydrophobic membrane anchor protein [Actibacterium sp. XHP0104]|uniref:succinate dehydrogenase, hydrophobic membrane anchor protein n=1 Tax=Actibacterium sp. XHP0104 TaxID=2984335 RepID=UPI0021E8CA57|nr:succinate dehydrogenase, hydrophobic membrane anchor protein [Actibacterium sp. XHP0104]MCV2882642.1 succinate dehydrogenase, hydrophobic membrane anchor protein [Actibacterium sp. XHP0104]
MRYLTDRKRAVGMGAAHSGTEHFWGMTVSAVALLILVPLFVFTFGPMLGKPHAEVVAYFGRPFPAIVAGLTLWVGFMHFKNGIRVAIEDYTHGINRKIFIIGATCLSYAAAATGLFALARIAL